MMEKVLNNKWLKIGLLSATGLLLVGGLVWAGVLIGRRQAIRDTQYAIRISPAPKPMATLIPTFPPEPILSPDETAGWKTYTNTKYGYKIKYPTGWFINSDSTTVVSQSFSDIEINNVPFNMRVSVTVNPHDINKEVFDKRYNEPVGIRVEELNQFEEKIANLVIGGQSAIKLASEGKIDRYYGIDVLVAKNGEIFFIQTAATNKEDLQKYESVFNLMLSSFKFLE